MKGVIERLLPEEGYGFVKISDGREFFLHRSALKATDFSELAVGSSVEFTIGDRVRGMLPASYRGPSTPI